MNCAKCGHANPAGSKFCGECGERLPGRCGTCGAENPLANRFCGSCGASLPDGAPQRAAPEASPPSHLAERILKSRAALEGERKQVTVLFADIKGSLEQIADRDPEEARMVLDPVLERMMEAVHAFEGTVNQVMGDGIMALFGAPIAHEDHAIRACFAALRMQESVLRDRDAAPPAARIRVGLNSGEVVVRTIGSDLRMDYTAVGLTTHLAARMEQLAEPGTVRMTAGTHRLVDAFVEAIALGPTIVKGLTTPVETFQLMRVQPPREQPLQARAARGLSQFVARTGEMATLQQAFEETRDGHGRVVAVAGEPGVGKSRLIWEFTRSLSADRATVLQTQARSHGHDTAYAPVIELLRMRFGLRADDTSTHIRDSVRRQVIALDPALQPTLPALLALLDASSTDDRWIGLDPTRRKRATVDAVKQLLLRQSLARPLVLVFEDLHWVDAETQGLLDALIAGIAAGPLLLIVSHRPEYRHEWSRKAFFRPLRLDRLAADGAEVLVDELLGSARALQPLKRWLLQRTDGNAFFIEESVRSLVESGVISGEQGNFALRDDLVHASIPATVQAILAARIDRLEPEDKALLQAAAVIGRDVPLSMLKAIVDGDDDDLRTRLARLQEAEFLDESQVFPKPEYTFRHALTHEVAYGTLLQQRRRALHARLVEVVQRRDGDLASAHIAMLAHHAFEGHLWATAVELNRRAAARAQALSAYREVVHHLEQAAEAASQLADDRAYALAAIDIRLDMRSPLNAIGETQRLRRHLVIARELAERCGDERRAAAAMCHESLCHWRESHFDAALDVSRRALEAARRLNDSELLLMATFGVAQALHAFGRYAEAVKLFDEVVRRIGEYPNQPSPLIARHGAHARSYLAWSLVELGDVERAKATADDALRVARTLRDAFAEQFARFAVGFVHWHAGDSAAALDALQPALDDSLTDQVIGFLPWLAAVAGMAHLDLHDTGRAMMLLRLGAGETGSWRGFPLAFPMLFLAEGCLRTGEVQEAARHAETLVFGCRARSEHALEAWALRTQARIAASRPDAEPEVVEALARSAMEHAQALGLRPLVAHIHADLAEGSACCEGDESASEHRACAEEIFEAIGMWRWRDRLRSPLAPNT